LLLLVLMLLVLLLQQATGGNLATKHSPRVLLVLTSLGATNL
jgi:hypothetical protein